MISSLDLDALIRQTADSQTADTGPSQQFDRPDMDTDYVAPAGATEQALAGFWQDLLGVADPGADDSFFDFGGHSLIAVRLVSLLRKNFGVELPISVLFEAPTIAKLATLIDARTGTPTTAESAPVTKKTATPRFTHLVAMHDGDGGPGAPFFMVSGMFGNVLNLRHLAQSLGADRPFYGLQARGLLGGEDPHLTVETAAADMIAEIKSIQPDGPYHLGGFSGGGITAYEMAQQLRRTGDEVASLIMLDTPLPVRPALTRRDKALIKHQEIRRKGIGYLVEWAQNRLRWEREKRAHAATATESEHQFHDRDIEAAFRQAVAAYELQPWDGPLTLIRPPLDRHWQVSGGRWVSAAREYVYADNDWTGWARCIEVIEVPGDHDSMVLSPNVRTLVRRMRASIAAAEAPSTPNIPELPQWASATAAE